MLAGSFNTNLSTSRIRLYRTVPLSTFTLLLQTFRLQVSHGVYMLAPLFTLATLPPHLYEYPLIQFDCPHCIQLQTVLSTLSSDIL